MSLLAEHWARLLIMGFLLGMSAVFSGSETAFFSLTRSQVRRLREDGAHLDHLLCRLLGSPRRLLISVLLGNLAVNVCYFSMAADLSVRAAAGRMETMAVGISAVSLLLLIFFGEFLPKGVALHRPIGFARVTAVPVFLFGQVALPVRILLERVVRFVSKAMGGRELPPSRVTRGELKAFVRLSGSAGRLDDTEQDMVEDVIELGEVRVKEVMVPRVDMVAADLGEGRDGILEVARAERVSKVVVYEGSLDNVIGFVAVKELLYRPGEPLEGLVRGMPAVPETKGVEALLREFQSNRAAVALVLDEYGGTEGIVTPEDLVEVIFGEIEDEYDPAEGAIRVVGPGHLLLAGEVTLREWEERSGVALPPGKYETVAGYVVSILDRMPLRGDAVEASGFRFTVVHVRRGRVVSLVAERTVGARDA